VSDMFGVALSVLPLLFLQYTLTLWVCQPLFYQNNHFIFLGFLAN